MHSLSDSAPKSPRGTVAELRLTSAYKAVFSGNSNKEDADIVLVDLANSSGFYRALGPSRSADERAFDDGRRWMMQRIVHFLYRDGLDLMALQEAAMREHRIDFPQSYGEQSPLDDYS